jgi:hypothetical protein
VSGVLAHYVQGIEHVPGLACGLRGGLAEATRPEERTTRRTCTLVLVSDETLEMSRAAVFAGVFGLRVSGDPTREIGIPLVLVWGLGSGFRELKVVYEATGYAPDDRSIRTG